MDIRIGIGIRIVAQAMSSFEIDPISRRRLPDYILSPPGLADWALRAACSGADAETFFAGGRGQEMEETVAEALAVCDRCPVLSECLAHAEETPERFGVWGGMTARDRGWDAYGRRSDSHRKKSRGGEADTWTAAA
ncbi:WhiB family transcriptional regulator [Streptoverticillium reticulum]|uniref:WhiB family transcriptional regulator n=1 Tax=Streptoverticillium reticulum TaxID=1433415 RepID=UPI0039BFFA1A